MAKTVKAGLTALPLGGVGEIGMNMMVYECDNQMIIVDAGISFADEAAPGVDAIIPDTYYIRERVKRLKGLIITHAHEDHIGGVPYIWEDLAGAPVYVSPFARSVLEHKLKETGIEPEPNQIVTVEVGKKYKVGPKGSKKHNFEIEYVPVTHSIPEANSICIRTPYGNLVHTGDFKFDDKPAVGTKTDEARLRQIGEEGVLATFCDSTNVLQEKHSGHEGDVKNGLQSHIAGASGALFFATFSSNIGRVISAAEHAAAAGRKVCFLSRSMKNMLTHARANNMIPEKLEASIVDAEEVSALPRNKMCIMLAGTQGEPRSAMGGISRGESVRGISANEGDTLILSSRYIPGNERAIFTMMNNFMKLGVKVKNPKNTDEIHVSGHASRGEVRHMYKLLDPKIIVPVHGEYTHLLSNCELARELKKDTFLITDGVKLYLGPDEARIMEEETPRYGMNFIDGLNILDEDRWVLRERRVMSMEGLATVTLMLDKKGKIKSKPVVKSRGLIDEDLQPEVIKAAQKEVLEALDSNFGEIIDDINKAEELMRQAVRRAFNRERGRKPITIPTILKG